MWFSFFGRRGNASSTKRLSETYRSLLHEYVSCYRHLQSDRRDKLDAVVATMVARRGWVGCAGLDVTDEMKAAIAGNASLMLLGTDDYSFGSVESILIYPDPIRRERNGHSQTVVGEAWDNGSVVLAWSEVVRNTSWPGHNVVIHEFAHHLDGLDGEMGGSIQFSSRQDQDCWHEVSGQAYRRHVAAVEQGHRTLLDPYGAKNPAEFFAVATECFFELPVPMEKQHQELFVMLTKYFQTDPRAWSET